MGSPGKSMVLPKSVKKSPLQPHRHVQIKYVKLDLLQIIVYITFRYNLSTSYTLTHRKTSVRTCCQDLHSSAVNSWLRLTPSSKPVRRTCATATIVLRACVQPHQSTLVSALTQAGNHSNGRPHNCVVRTAIKTFICSSLFSLYLYQNHCF